MKKQDIIFLLFFSILLIPFLPFSFLSSFHKGFLYNDSYWLVTSFIKFSLLATTGEVIGLRIKTGNYFANGFGIIPRMLVWGFLGITIKIAFVLFATGIPIVTEKYFMINGTIESMNFKDIFQASQAGYGFKRILAAFFISFFINIFYAPIMMTFHKITDYHITKNGGTLKGFFTKINFIDSFNNINWNIHWGFVLKKTIPFFWIPMQTINFLVAPEFRVVIAAFLGIILGILLSVASIKK